MKTAKKLLVLLLLSLFLSPAYAWTKKYPDCNTNRGRSALEISTGGYLLAVSCNNSNQYDMRILRVDSDGNTLWNKLYLIPGDGGLYSAFETSGDTFVVSGLATGSAFMMKIDGSGNSLWSRTYAGSNGIWGCTSRPTLDGGFVMCGTYSVTTSSGMYLLKTDANGVEQWHKSYTTAGYFYSGYDVIQTADGGYMTAGTRYLFPSGDYDAVMLKADASGNSQWAKVFGGTSTDLFFGIIQSLDGGFCMSGTTQSYGAGNSGPWLVKTDAMGNSMWSRGYGSAGSGGGYGSATSDGGYIMAGSVAGNIYYFKTDANGNTQWVRSYGGGGTLEEGWHAQQTSDGGYLISGDTGAGEGVLIKTDSNGIDPDLYTPTFTITQTHTISPTITVSPTESKTSTITMTHTVSPTGTPTRTATRTITQTGTITETWTCSPTITITRTKTFPPTATVSATGGPAYNDAWADYHGNTSTAGLDSNTRYNPYSTLKPPLRLLWSRTRLKTNMTWGCVANGSPVVANGIVYLGGGNGVSDPDAFYAFDTKTGADIPGFGMAMDDVNSSPVIANGNIYVATAYGTIYAYDAFSGAAVSGFPVQAHHISVSYCSPIVADGIIYYGGDSGWIEAWDAQTGVVIAGFPVNTGAGEFSTMTVSNGVVYCPAPGGYIGSGIFARNAKTGVALPGFSVNWLNDGEPIVQIYNGAMFFGTTSCGYTRLSALNVLTGANVLWSPKNINTKCYDHIGNVAIANGILYFPAELNKLYAVDAATGFVQPGFPVSVSGTVVNIPAIANGYVYFGDTTNTLYAVDISNGLIAWHYTVPDIDTYHMNSGFGRCSAAIAENKLFISSMEGGGIFCFEFDPAGPTPTGTSTATATETPVITPSPTATMTPIQAATAVTVDGLFKVFPVPCKDQLSVMLNVWADNTAVEVGLYTVSFRLVRKYEELLSAGIKRVDFDVSDLTNGAYYISVRTENSGIKKAKNGVFVVLK